MNIQLIGSKVVDLSLSKTDKDIEKMEFGVSNAFSKDVLNSFIIDFNLKLKVDDNYMLTIQHISQFEADEDIDEEKKLSPFFSINAPAIAYPFLRAYVANFLLSSGYDPELLPTINFVKLAENESSE